LAETNPARRRNVEAGPGAFLRARDDPVFGLGGLDRLPACPGLRYLFSHTGILRWVDPGTLT
jgi:hypothetical protein